MPRAPDLSGIALDGRYELHAVIGEGTFGRVYRGLDRRLARRVAVKVIKPWWAEDPDWVRTFEREAQLLASISDPGIVQIFDVGAAPEGLYYVAELVEGESLADRLRRGPLPAPEACDVAEQLARALASAHSRRVVHRDVKPANVLISADGRIKVGDFGVAQLAEGSSDGVAATIAGTPRYMAPEQAQGTITTPATDVYGVGIVLYEMLAGHPPFEGSSSVELAMHHVNDRPPPLADDVPAALVEVVDYALAKAPADRYANGAVLAGALQSAAILIEDDEPTEAIGSAGGVGTLTPPVTKRPAQARRAPASRPRPVSEPKPERTLFREPMSPRHNVNPAARRRRFAVVGFVLLLGAGMLTGALVLAPGHLTVPDVHGLAKGRIRAKARRMDFRAQFSDRYSGARKGTAVSQSPKPGTSVTDGSPVRVTLSAGPAPVSVPNVVKKSTGDAEARLGAVKLRYSIMRLAAPGVTPGMVVDQSPGAGARRIPGSTIALSVAEVPQLRPLTSLTGASNGRSVPFRIYGTRWQLVTDMSYQGTCTFIFICDGPSAKVTNLRTGATVDQFGFAEGANKTRTIKAGPGLYQISVSAGNDSAKWAVKVDDYY
jgi:eukaryotic-like serine/threonine-protein kinase